MNQYRPRIVLSTTNYDTNEIVVKLNRYIPIFLTYSNKNVSSTKKKKTGSYSFPFQLLRTDLMTALLGVSLHPSCIFC